MLLVAEIVQNFPQIVELAKLSFDYILQKKYTFESSPLMGFSLGLLSQMLNGRAQIVSYFLNRSLQEYLAAVHLISLPVSEQQRLFKEHGQAFNFENVWRFISGLSQFQRIGWDLVKLHYGQLPYDEDFDEDEEENQSADSMVYFFCKM